MIVKEIRRVEITGGFLDSLAVDFAGGLNCIIGPRGAGKSTLLKLIRFACGDQPASANQRALFNQEIKQLLGSGSVKVYFINELGNKRILSRALGKYPYLVDENSCILQEGRELKIKIEAFGQGELEKVLADKNLLSIIDKTIEGLDKLQQTAAANLTKRRDIQTELEKMSAQMATAREQYDRKTLLLQELQSLEMEEPEKKYHAIMQERAWMDFWEKLLYSRIYSIKNLLSGDYRCVIEESFINSELIEAVSITVNQALEERGSLLSEAQVNLEAGLEAFLVQKEELNKAHQQQEEEVRVKLKEYGFQAADELSRQREKLLDELNSLAGCENEYRRLGAAISQGQERKKLLLLQAQQIDGQIVALRKSAVQRLNVLLGVNPLLKYSHHADLKEYRDFIAAIVGSTLSSKVIDKLIKSIRPEQLEKIAADGDFAVLSRLAYITPEEAQKLIWLLISCPNTGRLTELHLGDELEAFYVPPDRLPVNAGTLSQGMQCSMLLPIILMVRHQVLLGDQFEDNLDNACINELLVNKLEELKKRRQTILVTHNPNIVVGAACDRVIVLKSNGVKGWVEAAGGLEKRHIKNQIITLLEGGREAFSKRVQYLGVG